MSRNQQATGIRSVSTNTTRGKKKASAVPAHAAFTRTTPSRRRNNNNKRQDNSAYRVNKREAWFTITGQANGKRAFGESGYPLWFNRICQLYENYEMHDIRVSWESTYSSIAEGYLIGSFNSSPGDVISFEDAYLLGQKGAKQQAVRSTRGSITIPASAFKQTPNRRPCRGQRSWLFEFLYKIVTPSTGSITFFVEYDVTFRVPQLLPEQGVKPGFTKTTRNASASQSSQHAREIFEDGTNKEEGIIFDETIGEEGGFRFKTDKLVKILLNSVLSYANSGEDAIVALKSVLGGSTPKRAGASPQDETIALTFSLTDEGGEQRTACTCAGDYKCKVVRTSGFVQQVEAYGGEGEHTLFSDISDGTVAITSELACGPGEYEIELPALQAVRWCTIQVAVNEVAEHDIDF